MDELWNANIKETMHRHPAVEQVLKDHGIACADCSVGTCRLLDIIEIHGLNPEQERELMGRIAGIVYPGREIRLPAADGTNGGRRRSVAAGGTKPGAGLSPPIAKLVREHVLIKRLLDFIPRLIDELDENPVAGSEVVRGALDFIRGYADRFHHAKEEEVLFEFFDQRAEIFQVMRRDHEQVRSTVRGAQEALERRDYRTLSGLLRAYRELLQEHIKKEDEVLYPWIDRGLSVSQVGQLYSTFTAIDERFGDEPERHRRYIGTLEERYERQAARASGRGGSSGR